MGGLIGTLAIIFGGLFFGVPLLVIYFCMLKRLWLWVSEVAQREGKSTSVDRAANADKSF